MLTGASSCNSENAARNHLACSIQSLQLHHQTGALFAPDPIAVACTVFGVQLHHIGFHTHNTFTAKHLELVELAQIALAGLEQIGKEPQGVPVFRNGNTGFRKERNHLIIAAKSRTRCSTQWLDPFHLLVAIADVPYPGTGCLRTGRHHEGAGIGALP